MAIGVNKNDFFHSTPKELTYYDKAYELRRKVKDEQDFMLANYIYEAIAVVIHNAFAKKNSQPLKFRDKPYLQEIEEKKYLNRELTVDEKSSAIDILFGNLESMQRKFEKSKK